MWPDANQPLPRDRKTSRFVNQTVTGKTGNCFSACLASVFAMPIEEVPNFFDVAGEDAIAWWDAIRDWLKPLGYGIISVSAKEIINLPGLLIVGGEADRGNYHATIWENGVMVHDPHPSKSGLISVESIDLLYPLDPGAMKLFRGKVSVDRVGTSAE